MATRYWRATEALFRKTDEGEFEGWYPETEIGPASEEWEDAWEEYERVAKGDLEYDEITEAEARAFRPEAFGEAVVRRRARVVPPVIVGTSSSLPEENPDDLDAQAWENKNYLQEPKVQLSGDRDNEDDPDAQAWENENYLEDLTASLIYSGAPYEDIVHVVTGVPGVDPDRLKRTLDALANIFEVDGDDAPSPPGP